jgi:hypothetical protein
MTKLPALLPSLTPGGRPLALAFDESKHPRGERGTKKGGKFVSKEGGDEVESTSLGTARGLGANAGNARPGTAAFHAKHAKAAAYYERLAADVRSGKTKPSLSTFHRVGPDGKTQIVKQTVEDVAKEHDGDAGYHRSIGHPKRAEYESASAAANHASVSAKTKKEHDAAAEAHWRASKAAKEIGDVREVERHLERGDASYRAASGEKSNALLRDADERAEKQTTVNQTKVTTRAQNKEALQARAYDKMNERRAKENLPAIEKPNALHRDADERADGKFGYTSVEEGRKHLDSQHDNGDIDTKTYMKRLAYLEKQRKLNK